MVWVFVDLSLYAQHHCADQLGSTRRGVGGHPVVAHSLGAHQLQVGVANHNAIYAGSAFPIFHGLDLLLVVSGVSDWRCFCSRSPSQRFLSSSRASSQLQFRRREELALQIAVLLGVQYQQEDTKVSQERIMEVLNLEPSVLKVVLNDLESSLLICRTQTGDCVLAQQPERISLLRSLKPSKDLRSDQQRKKSSRRLP